MRRILILAAIAAIALIGTSCTTSGGDIFPMSVGSVWNMDMVATAAQDTFMTGTYVTTAVEKANLGSGEEVVKMKTEMSQHIRMPDTTITTTSYAYVREAGDWILSYSDLNDSTGDTVMVTTPTVGMKWHQGTGTTEVIGQEDVTVKAGTYKSAWKFKMTTSGTDFFYWYAKGIGMVKAHSEYEEQSVEWMNDMELTSATIK